MGKSWHKLWWSWLPEGVIPSIHKDKSWNSENDRDILLIYNSLSSTTVCKWQFGIGLALSVNSSIQLCILVTCRYCIDICRYYSSHYIPMSFPLNQHEFSSHYITNGPWIHPVHIPSRPKPGPPEVTGDFYAWQTQLKISDPSGDQRQNFQAMGARWRWKWGRVVTYTMFHPHCNVWFIGNVYNQLSGYVQAKWGYCQLDGLVLTINTFADS